MSTIRNKEEMKPLEIRMVVVGFWLTGLAITVTGVSYLLNMTFTFQWLVWVLGIAFIAVALITLEWPRASRNR